jgi:hypothetical protein
MDKLEQYLDQVCRSIGGPRSMRHHVRQELREHLLDAVAQHRATGLAEDTALAKALEEFGRPEEVRSELEATHGQRLIAVLIDRAMQWKEMTMKAKWLWSTGAYLSLVLLIALEALFLSFVVIFIIPKFQKLMRDGIIDPAIIDEQGIMWMPRFLNGLSHVGDRYTTFIMIGAAAAWGMFEWRVRSENKPFMRVLALGTVAVGLLGVVIMTTGSLLISACMGVPAMGQISRMFALDQIVVVDTSVGTIEQALAKKEWDAMQQPADRASRALARLTLRPVVAALPMGNGPPSEAAVLEAQLHGACERFAEVQQAIRDKDAPRLETALGAFHKSFGPVREAAEKRIR